jgi:prepilin-type N-terminal cleavage/methylation domain-containing protein
MRDAMIKQNFCKMTKHFRHARAFSLVETMIAVALIGVIALIWMRFMKGANDMSASAQTRQKVVAIEHYLLGFSNCEKTSADPNFSTSCSTNGPINIRDENGNIVIPETGKLFGTGSNAVKVINNCNDGTINFTAELLGENSKKVTLYDGIPLYCATASPQQCVNVKDNLCPATYAALAFIDGAGQGIYYSHEIQCCPMPPDLLSNTHQVVEKVCAADHVVTGVVISNTAHPGMSATRNRHLRCTQINTSKYMLETGDKVKTHFYQTRTNHASGWGSASRINIVTTTNLSSARKFQLMKKDNLNTDPFHPGTLQLSDETSDGYGSQCISPNGNGLFVERSSKYCGTHYTRQVRLKGPGPVVELSPTACTGSFSTIYDSVSKSDTVTLKNAACATFPYFWGETPNLRR